MLLIYKISLKNIIYRLTKLITLDDLQSDYFIPKELPTINLLCQISLENWYNMRKILMKRNNITIAITDSAYSLQFIIAFLILAIFILDYYGALWE